MGRLDGALSPYLLSHAKQSVDWFPWGSEAFAHAASRDCPVLISIGYSTCHWCHVMSRESFDDPEIGQLLREHVVAIKVDREEHPEVDAVYMAQAQAFTTNLGWPLTVFATPEGATFYAATYLPPEPRNGQPSLRQVVEAVSTAWREKRDDVMESSRALAGALREISAPLPEHSRDQKFPSVSQLGAVVDALLAVEDSEYGGFGSAPKFPVTPALSFLHGEACAGHAGASALVRRTLQTYANSALRDPLEGGFFRYATQRDFSEPHYERMLYDNAGLLALYSDTGELEVASGIVSFLRNQLLVEGGFGSAQDSESLIDGEPREGGYYLLSEKDRARQTPPHVDDKVITGWNGLALMALAKAHLAGVPGDPGGLGMEVAQSLLDHHLKDDGRLIRLSRGGIPGDTEGTREDYGALAYGLLELGCATGFARGIEVGFTLLDTIASEGELLGHDPVLAEKGFLPRPDIQEGAMPSGVSLVAGALLLAFRLSGDRTFLDRAQALLAPYVAEAMLNPLGSGGVLRVLAMMARESQDIIIVSDRPTPLTQIALSHQGPGTLVLSVTGDHARELEAAGVAILQGRSDGSTPTAYVCHNGVCALPVHEATELLAQLGQ